MIERYRHGEDVSGAPPTSATRAASGWTATSATARYGGATFRMTKIS
jgi:hypothetical protein